jgi:hypothetical protein
VKSLHPIPSGPMRAVAASVALTAATFAFVALRYDPQPPRAEVMSTADVFKRLQWADTKDRLRSVLGDPTQVEIRGKGSLWTYEGPFPNVARLQIRFGEDGRVVAVGLSPLAGAPSLGAQLDRDYGSRCTGWARSDQTVWCFDPRSLDS